MGHDPWLALVLAPGLGNRSFNRLLASLGSALGWLERSDRELLEAGLNRAQISALRQPDADALALCQAWLDQPDHWLVTLDDPY